MADTEVGERRSGAPSEAVARTLTLRGVVGAGDVTAAFAAAHDQKAEIAGVAHAADVTRKTVYDAAARAKDADHLPVILPHMPLIAVLRALRSIGDGGVRSQGPVRLRVETDEAHYTAGGVRRTDDGRWTASVGVLTIAEAASQADAIDAVYAEMWRRVDRLRHRLAVHGELWPLAAVLDVGAGPAR